MKKMSLICFVTLMLISMVTKAQENKVKFKLSGFVEAETFWDSRKNVSTRDGAIMLYPKNKMLDANGNDLNDHSDFFMTAAMSRLRATVSGFNAFGAKGVAVLEADFAGTANDKTGLLRLRHAFVKLDWANDQLIVGKYWHPMFVVSAFPRVLHTGGGIPFGVLNRAPQVRFTHKLSDKTSVNFAVLSEMDFKSTGPDGANVKYAQQAGVPEFSLQAKTKIDAFELGATVGFKTLMPTLVNSNDIEVNEKLTSFHSNAWLAYTASKFKWNVQAIYGQNMYNFVCLGGYGVKNVKDNGDYEYTNMSTMSLTSDIYTTTGNLRYALNAGYTKNLGAADDLAKDAKGFIGLYSRGADIDYMYQVAPRIELYSGKMLFGAEAVYTAAAYGDTQIDGTVNNTDIVGSTRLIFHVRYSF